MAAAPIVHPGTGAAVEQEVVGRVTDSASHYCETTELEAAFADFVGARHAVALSSGSAALHLALIAHGIGTGDEVIVSPLCPPAVVSAILAVHARPVYADVNSYTFTIDPLAVERALACNHAVQRAGFSIDSSRPHHGSVWEPTSTGDVGAEPRTQNPEPRTPASGWPTRNGTAILAVHLFGQPCDMVALTYIARTHGLAVVEVVWEALGATLGGEPLGGSGTAVYSFQRGMAINTGEGGMLTTNDAGIAEAVRLLANNGCDCHGRMHGPGFNYRMPEVIVELAMKQLPRVEGQVSLQQLHAEELTHGLAGIPGIVPPAVLPGAQHSFQRYAVRITPEFPFSVNETCRRLRERGVEASHCHIVPPHRHPFHQRGDFPGGSAPHAEEVSRELLFLPVGPLVKEEELHETVRALRLMATDVAVD